MAFIKVADIDDLQSGEMKCVVIGKHRVALARLDDGYYAFNDTCSHMEESLTEGILDGNCVICPMHQSQFDVRTGKALSLPANTPVPTYAVKLADGAVWVDTDCARSQLVADGTAGA